ncbi:MAG: hypothetical protein OEQ18_10020 [Gammaproteobacteria bacterium]|nr:hypothetical protein [Gammaproteobacteria bacterium]
MILNITINERPIGIDVPEEVVADADDFFARMDGDMNRGWQMGRDYVENPTDIQRCQIAADKLFTALHTGNKNLMMLMAAYILAKFPDTHRVDIDTTGNMQQTRLHFS